MPHGDLPQLGLYCHGKESKISTSRSSKQTKKMARYLPLRCNVDGTFTRFKGKRKQKIDIYQVNCTKEQFPILRKHQNEPKLCSNRGADGRHDDLETYIHSVQIGWNMSPVNHNKEIKEQVCMFCYFYVIKNDYAA